MVFSTQNHTMLRSPTAPDHHHTPDAAADADDDATDIRDIHALTSPSTRRGRSWSSSLSMGSVDSENFATMSREFNALVVAGSTDQTTTDTHNTTAASSADTTVTTALGRIGEEQLLEETNPLAIVPDSNPIPLPLTAPSTSNLTDNGSNSNATVSVHRVKKEETESKIAAWETAEIAKINNRFKRQGVVINGWESEKAEKAGAWLKKVERKLEEKRARATEKMQNEVARARRKAEEKRASAEAKRGAKVAKVMEMGNLLRIVGRAPSKRSFFF